MSRVGKNPVEVPSGVDVAVNGRVVTAKGSQGQLAYEAAGEVTFGEAFSVQPFGNSLVTMTLTGAQIDALLEQMSGEAVAERARRQALVDLGRCLCCMAVAIEVARRHVLDRILTWKNPSP